jgi:hypothetical protein
MKFDYAVDRRVPTIEIPGARQWIKRELMEVIDLGTRDSGSEDA